MSEEEEVVLMATGEHDIEAGLFRAKRSDLQALIDDGLILEVERDRFVVTDKGRDVIRRLR